MSNLDSHYKPSNFSDKVALSFTKFLRFLADTFFKKRYGHRAVVLETVAAVPGMVAGMLIHYTTTNPEPRSLKVFSYQVNDMQCQIFLVANNYRAKE